MRQDILIDTVEALVKSETGIAPPFVVVLPLNFSPTEQVINGQDNGESLKERLLRINNVKDVIRGTTMGVSLKH